MANHEFWKCELNAGVMQNNNEMRNDTKCNAMKCQIGVADASGNRIGIFIHWTERTGDGAREEYLPIQAKHHPNPKYLACCAIRLHIIPLLSVHHPSLSPFPTFPTFLLLLAFVSVASFPTYPHANHLVSLVRLRPRVNQTLVCSAWNNRIAIGILCTSSIPHASRPPRLSASFRCRSLKAIIVRKDCGLVALTRTLPRASQYSRRRPQGHENIHLSFPE